MSVLSIDRVMDWKVQMKRNGRPPRRLEWLEFRQLLAGHSSPIESDDATVLHAGEDTSANTAPLAVDDDYAILEDSGLLFVLAPGVMANDADLDRDSLTVEIEEPPIHGTLNLLPNGTFIYNAQPDFFGVDTFTYRLADRHGEYDVATVQIKVNPVHDPAEGVLDVYHVRPGERFVVNANQGVLVNDRNPDLEPLVAVLESDAALGEVALGRDGSFVYQSPPKAAVDAFWYRVDDGDDESLPTRVDLIVNTPPKGVADQYSVAEDEVLVVSAVRGVLANDRDADRDPLKVSLVESTKFGSLDFSVDGSFTYRPNPNYNGKDDFSYRLADQNESTDPVRVVLSVLPVNDVPQAVADRYVTLPNTEISIPINNGLLRNDLDVEGGLMIRLVDRPAHGELRMATDGSFVYQPEEGFSGVDRFLYQAVDGQDLSQPALVTIAVVSSPITISEVMVSNAGALSTIVREDVGSAAFEGERISPDWIELHNNTTVPLELGGLHLSDSRALPKRWKIPRGTVVQADEFVVFFASGDPTDDVRYDERGYLHTNFRLSGSEDEAVLLTSYDGRVLHELVLQGTTQRTNVSYGFENAEEPRYYLQPTPEAVNAEALQEIVADPKFSVTRGFFAEPFQLEISAGTPFSEIRYTIDGSQPSETSRRYHGPIWVDKTQVIRARSWKKGSVPSRVATQSFLFLEDIVHQDADLALQAGFPSSWGGVEPDYGLVTDRDLPLVVGDLTASDDAARNVLRESLMSLPSLSVVMDTDDLFGEQGIYSNPEKDGVDWERTTSVELLLPDGSEGFQVDAGIRIHGGAHRSMLYSKKKSFRLLFKGKYGSADFSYPLFGPDATDRFQSLVLRMESNDGWSAKPSRGQPLYTRDQFSRETFLAMGQPASHGRNFHLYLNGQYWGMYNVVERADEAFGEAYFDSDRYAWDGFNNEWPMNAAGDLFRRHRGLEVWKTVKRMSNAIRAAESEAERTARYMALIGRNSDGSENPSLPQWIDPVNYVDYLLVNYYGGNGDWPHNNFISGRENSPNSEGLKYFPWDTEITFGLGSKRDGNLLEDQNGAANPWYDLRLSREFRLLVADRIQRHFFNGGALYVDPEYPHWDSDHPERNVPASRLMRLTDSIRDALVAESARWGDQHREVPYTRDIEWQVEVDRVLSEWLSSRSAELFELLRERDLFPKLKAPVFLQRGGVVNVGVPIQLTAERGKIYYTIDGVDPREVGGAVSASALEYQGELRLSESATVKTRAFDGEVWSALDEATFLVDGRNPMVNGLRISEVNYHPAPLRPIEIDAGIDDVGEFEYIEIINVSDQILDLTRTQLLRIDGEGVEFDFSRGRVKQVAPGETLLVVENREAFELRYGHGHRIAGQWRGRLSNRRETLHLYTDGLRIHQFTYRDDWYPNSDGIGASLEVIDDDAERDRWGNRRQWRASIPGGTPGQNGGIFPGDINGDRRFTPSDIVLALAAGEYEDGVAGNSTFREGDWDGDGDFTSQDFVFMFQLGTFEVEDSNKGG